MLPIIYTSLPQAKQIYFLKHKLIIETFVKQKYKIFFLLLLLFTVGDTIQIQNSILSISHLVQSESLESLIQTWIFAFIRFMGFKILIQIFIVNSINFICTLTYNLS